MDLNILRACHIIWRAQCKGKKSCNIDMPPKLYPEVFEFIKSCGFRYHVLDYSINVFFGDNNLL